MLTEKLTPKELVLKHIFDKNHVVTEEELKNVKVGVASFPDENTAEPKKKPQAERTITT